ncbi:unnamed protein product, partial [Discosporangium mesarthrocarpum]
MRRITRCPSGAAPSTMILPRGKHGVSYSSGTVRAKKSTTSWPRTTLYQKYPRKEKQSKHNKEKEHKEYQRNNVQLWSMLTLAIRGPTAHIVWNHHLDRVGAWKELEHTYGNKGSDDRASK